MIPCYNSRATAHGRSLEHDTQLLFVNDGSTDDTSDVPRIDVVARERRQGRGGEKARSRGEPEGVGVGPCRDV